MMAFVHRVAVQIEHGPFVGPVLDPRLRRVALITERLQIALVPRIATGIDRLNVIDLRRRYDESARLALAAPRLLAQMFPAKAIPPCAPVVETTTHANTRSVKAAGTNSPEDSCASALTT